MTTSHVLTVHHGFGELIAPYVAAWSMDYSESTTVRSDPGPMLPTLFC